MTPATLEASLKRVLRSEGFLTALLQPAPLPVPNNVDAEQDIVGSLLAGRATLKDVEGLRREDFYSWVLGLFFSVARSALEAGIQPVHGFVRRVLAEEGVSGAEIDKELEVLRDSTPFGVPEQAVSEILKRARERRLLEFHERQSAQLRAGAIDYETALARCHAYRDE